MGFDGMLVDLGKLLGAFAIVLITGVSGVDGVIMGNVQPTDYVLLGVMVIAMLYAFYMIQHMQSTSY